MSQHAYAVKDGTIVAYSSNSAWAAQCDRVMPIGEVYVYRSFDEASSWRMLQRRNYVYGLGSTSAQLLPIKYEQLPEVVKLAFMLVD